MRTILAAAALGLLAVPALPSSSADAQRWYGYGDHRSAIRHAHRECRRDLRRADSRREYRRELRDCRRDLREARRDWRDYRWRGSHYGYRYPSGYFWDGWRWRRRW